MKCLVNAMTINDIEAKTGICRDFTRIAFDGYKLSKYIIARRPITIDCSDKFLDEFDEYLLSKGALDKLEKAKKLRK